MASDVSGGAELPHSFFVRQPEKIHEILRVLCEKDLFALVGAVGWQAYFVKPPRWGSILSFINEAVGNDEVDAAFDMKAALRYEGWLFNSDFENSSSLGLKFECTDNGTMELTKEEETPGTGHSNKVYLASENVDMAYHKTSDAAVGDNAVTGKVKNTFESKLYDRESVEWSISYVLGVAGSSGIDSGGLVRTQTYRYAYECVCEE